MQYLTVIRNTAESAISCRKTCVWLITETLFFCPLLSCARNPSLRGERSPWNQSSAAWWHGTPNLSHPSSSWTWSVGKMKWTRRRRCHWSTSQRASCTTSSAFLAGWWKMAGIKVGSTAWCAFVALCCQCSPTGRHLRLRAEAGCWSCSHWVLWYHRGARHWWLSPFCELFESQPFLVQRDQNESSTEYFLRSIHILPVLQHQSLPASLYSIVDFSFAMRWLSGPVTGRLFFHIHAATRTTPTPVI